MQQARRIAGVCVSLLLGATPAVWSASSSEKLIRQGQDRRRDTYLERRIERVHEQQDTEGTTSTSSSPAAEPVGATRLGQGAPSSSAQPPAPEAVTPEEIVAAIKLRAQEELARRRARKWDLDTLLVWTVEDETNPNFSKAHKSALATDEYLSSIFSYRVTPQVQWQVGYALDALNYNGFTDLSTFTNSLTTKLIWWFATPLRAEVHYTFDDNQYLYDRGSSSWDQTVHLRLRHSFLQHYYHYVGWSYLNRQYKDQPTLDGNDNRVSGKYRKDQRQTGIYEVGGTFGEQTALRVRQEFYFHTSNAAFQDFYDAQDYKVRVSGSHDWTTHWSSSGSFTYELKRYEQRDVSDRAVTERDNVQTYQLGVTYRLSPEVDLTYTWRYMHQFSNDAAQKFGDITNSLALTAAF